ncbi:MAG: alpha/beta fold hydrolase, partial [Alphaproteobacteria bacterium]|nr:alpha/beta fold hydrolase [Alphaproteobacteria bacterium]MDX5417426.1 alpha/beta fold hydrolase [Alphaproteobacteria bacterium]MDX5494899.1 alpha/beta fold hydrolase [Alphaproteobacteria bacterium]
MNDRTPRYRDIRVGSNVLRTAVWEGKGRGRPLLFFNGIGANIELIAPLAEALSDRDIIAFDAPGVGGSPAAALPYRPWQFARMAAGILDELGYSEVDVMGVSWGGAMAQQFAFQFGSRVHRLILAATSAGFFMVPGKPAALAKLAHPKRYMNPDYMLQHFEMLYGDEQHGADGHASRLRAPSFRGYFYQLLAGRGCTSVPFLPFLTPDTLVLGPDDRPLAPGADEPGLLATRTAAKGYYKDAEKSARTFKEIDGAWYVVTGDWATLHEDGTITLHGRGS